MKKLITLVLTLALCVPMFMMTSVEARAESETTLCFHGCGEEADPNVTDDYICTDCLTESVQWAQYESVQGGGHMQYALYECGYKAYEPYIMEHRYDDGNASECVDCGYDECDHNTYSMRYVILENGKHFEYPFCTLCWGHVYARGVEKEHVIGANGACVCGYGSSCGSVSENSTPAPAPKEEPKYEAPSAAEIMEMEIEEIAQATEAVIKAEVEIPVTDFVSTEAVNALPAEVKDTTGDEAVYNLSKITTTRGFVAAVAKMVETNNNSAQKSKAVTFYSSTPFAFNTSSLTALADTATEFVYMFKHDGHVYKVTIPAGAKVDLEGQMFAGPLYIGAKLGTTVVVK